MQTNDVLSGRPGARPRRPAFPCLERLETRVTPADLVFNVTNGASGDVPGSLRRAILDANAASGRDTIQFDSAAFGVGKLDRVTLTSVLPNITDDVSILGVDDLRIRVERSSSAPDFRILNFAPLVQALVQDLTVAGGRSAQGAGIRAGGPPGGEQAGSGTLVLTRCTFEDNALTATEGAGGGAIYGDAYLTLILHSCLVQNNGVLPGQTGFGGGIYNLGSLQIDSSDFIGNRATSGGALYNAPFGDMTTYNSTFEGNTASTSGGAITNLGTGNIEGTTLTGNVAGVRGGAITNGDADQKLVATVTISNTTISGNQVTSNLASAGGAGIHVGSSVESSVFVRFSTITANTTGSGARGGIWLDTGSLFLGQSIVSGNTGNLVQTGGNYADRGSNLLDGDAKLGPLAFNGGGTQTHRLLPGSPALDAATSQTEQPTDQRGRPRPQHGAYDIGAFEAETSGIDHYEIQAPTGVVAGQPFSLRVRPVNVFGEPVFPGGDVNFSSSDPSAVLPGKTTLAIPDEDGFYTISGFVLNGAGGQTITVREVPMGVIDPVTSQVQVAVQPSSSPTLVVGDDQFLNAGETFTRTGQVVGGEGPFTVRIDYGDGSGFEFVTVNEDGTFPMTHTYAVEGSYLVQATLFANGNQLDTKPFFVDVLLPGVPVNPARKAKVPPGGVVTISAPGVTATYFRSPQSVGIGAIIVATVPTGVADHLDNQVFVSAGLTISAAYDVRAVNAGPKDLAVVTFRYDSAAPVLPTLTYFDRATGQQVVIPHSMYVVDVVSRTITIIFNSATTPRLQDMSGTVFTIAVPIIQPAPPVPITTSPLLLPSGNVLTALGDAGESRAMAMTGTFVGVVFTQSGPVAESVSELGINGGAGGSETQAAGGEVSPLQDLPRVPSVLTNLPSVTVTPAGVDPSAQPEPTSRVPEKSPPGEDEAEGKGEREGTKEGVQHLEDARLVPESAFSVEHQMEATGGWAESALEVFEPHQGFDDSCPESALLLLALAFSRPLEEKEER